MSRIATLARTISALRGRRRAAVAALLGVALTAALPPVYAVPFLLVAFCGLAWLLDGARSARDAALIGWWFGFGHFVTGLYWIAIALLVDAAQFGWMVPFAVFGLSGIFAFYTAGVTLAAWKIGARGVAGAVVFAVCWTAGEWLRGHLLSGFPWNLTATAWADLPLMMQPAAWLGGYGLGMLTVLVAMLPAGVAGPMPGRSRWLGLVLAVAILAVWMAGGALRLTGADGAMVPDVRLRLVQPDIAQNLKWDPARVEENFRQSVALTRSAGFETRTHVIWSESAAPFYLSNDAGRLDLLAAGAVPPGGILVTGALRTTPDPRNDFRVWNSLYAIDGRGIIQAVFDKFHLVPFGEYVPLRQILNIAKITHGSVDFSTGPGNVTLSLPGAPKFSPLICYEIIFPGHVVDASDRPQWIINITNDAWFGISSGPYQHFAAARMRAVEEGLPVARSANDGISGVIDPFGYVVASLGLGRRGVVDADLPRALDPPPYARFGDWLVLVLGVFLLFGARHLPESKAQPD